jgi:hypothetical protein
LPRSKTAAGHRNNKRIVTRKLDVDPIDLADCQPEPWHLDIGLKLREERPNFAGIKDLQHPVHTTPFGAKAVLAAIAS